MRIAQVSPLYESVPPRRYGGTERVVSNLTEELVELGHDVTLFASGDSQTAARLVASCPRSLREAEVLDVHAPHILQLEHLMSRDDEFDIVHFHTDYFHFPLSRRADTPRVTTLHGRLDLPGLVPIYREFRDMALVSISDSQRRAIPWAHWVGTVHHGLDTSRVPLRAQPDPHPYLAVVGRMSPEKRVDDAIRIAREAGIELRIGAKVDPADRDYFQHAIKPLLAEPGVTFLGEVTEKEKFDLLGGARAMLFPVDWPEPFGLVMIESMACGTPVVARRRGSVPEVVEDGRTGVIFERLEDGAAAVERAITIDRAECRRAMESRFSAREMAERYVTIYERLLNQPMGTGSGAGAIHG